MTDRSRTTGDDRTRAAGTDELSRRGFVALGAGASATLLAGCAGDGGVPSTDGSDGSGDADGSRTLTGGFRLLISDAPADIGDFDRLDVTLDRARVFEAGDGDEEDEEPETDDEDEEGSDEGAEQNATETAEDDGNATETDDANETADGEDDEGDRGFTVVELDDATVDLTRVIEDDAIAVFDGEIPAGSYEKIELGVSAVEGVVDGEAVDVKLPSEKLQITNGFEVTPDEPVSFVFDINVVKRGKNNGYILKPVISGSGVAGRDVDVNEIDDEGEEDEDEDEEPEAGDSEADEDAETDDATDGNETDDDENGTASGS